MLQTRFAGGDTGLAGIDGGRHRKGVVAAMIIFIVNCGSSSIKYQVFDMVGEVVKAKGIVERLGTGEAILEHTVDGVCHEHTIPAANHTEGVQHILEVLIDAEIGVLGSVDEIQGVGHRVVHGGEALTESVQIDESVLATIREMIPLAPLHNPANLAGIEAAMLAMPNVPHVATFDTAFHATMPPAAFRYAVPEEWYTDHKVRRYGFHGTSHLYVTRRMAAILGKPVEEVNLITCHLGNGGSITAVRNGESIDTSMGLTPLEGIVMGTRSGDIDPAIVEYMLSCGLTIETIMNQLNKESGLQGLSKLGNDMRDILKARDGGDERAALAVEVYCRRIAKYVGAYMVLLGSVDAVVMTGGVGENSKPVRQYVCEALNLFGATYDAAGNDFAVRREGAITTADSELPVWIVPTNEELMIARDTAGFVS
jgi:acetate kinase